MKGRYTHPSDEDLLSFIDGELRPDSSLQIERHLAECWDCRARWKTVQQTIADFMQVHHDSLDCHLPRAEGPRALLRARVSEYAKNSRRSWLEFLLRPIGTERTRYIAIGLAVLIVGAAGGYGFMSARNSNQHAAPEAIRLVPDSQLTPGLVRPISLNEVCTTTYSDDTDEVPASIRQQVFSEYRVASEQSQSYGLDYLVSPQLGGTADIRNLWPEPEAQTLWNMRAKDALEDHLHELVCEGKIDLATAQRDLASNWILAYQKYFHTNMPLKPL